MTQISSFLFGHRESREGCRWVQGEARFWGNRLWFHEPDRLHPPCRGAQGMEVNLVRQGASPDPSPLTSLPETGTAALWDWLLLLSSWPAPEGHLKIVSGHQLGRKGLPGLSPGLGKGPLEEMQGWEPSTADLGLASGRNSLRWGDRIFTDPLLFL